MSHVHDKAIAECESKLIALIGEAKQTPGLFERVELWVARMTSGKKLSAYLHDESIDGKDRVTVAKSLVQILLTQEHDRLPAVGEPPVPVPAEKNAEAEAPAPDEIRAMIRREVRRELAATLETIAKILRETA